MDLVGNVSRTIKLKIMLTKEVLNWLKDPSASFLSIRSLYRRITSLSPYDSKGLITPRRSPYV